MGQPQGEEEEGWDVEGRVMTRGTEGVERWGVGVKGEEGGGEGGCGVLYSCTACCF